MSDRIQNLVHHLNPQVTILETRPLTGGISAQMQLVLFEDETGAKRCWIVRTPADKVMYELLKFLADTAVSTPAPIYFDTHGQFSDAGLLIMSFLEGEMLFNPADPLEYATQMAEQLAAIHALPVPDFLEYDPNQHERLFREQFSQPTALDTVFQVDRIKSFLARWQPKLNNHSRLLHGDFWPGNTLWQGEKLAAVIDWEDVYLADPLQDLAKSRSELAWIFGEEVLNQFTKRYQELMPLDYSELPYWDLLAVLRFVRLCEGELDWIQEFFGEYGRTDLTSIVVTQRVNQFIRNALQS